MQQQDPPSAPRPTAQQRFVDAAVQQGAVVDGDQEREIRGAPASFMDPCSVTSQIGGQVMFNRVAPKGRVYVIAAGDRESALCVRATDVGAGRCDIQFKALTGCEHVHGVLDELYRESVADEVSALQQRAREAMQGISLPARARLRSVIKQAIRKLVVIDGGAA